MKKFVFGMIMMVAFIASCTTTPALPAATENDSTATDTTVTTVVDTTVAVDAPDSAATIEKVTE